MWESHTMIIARACQCFWTYIFSVWIWDRFWKTMYLFLKLYVERSQESFLQYLVLGHCLIIRFLLFCTSPTTDCTLSAKSNEEYIKVNINLNAYIVYVKLTWVLHFPFTWPIYLIFLAMRNIYQKPLFVVTYLFCRQVTEKQSLKLYLGHRRTLALKLVVLVGIYLHIITFLPNKQYHCIYYKRKYYL